MQYRKALIKRPRMKAFVLQPLVCFGCEALLIQALAKQVADVANGAQLESCGPRDSSSLPERTCSESLYTGQRCVLCPVASPEVRGLGRESLQHFPLSPFSRSSGYLYTGAGWFPCSFYFILLFHFWLCCVFVAACGLFCSCGELGLLFVAVCRLPTAVASRCGARALGTWASVVVACGL